MRIGYINEMSTTLRHNHLVSSFFGDIFPLFKSKQVFPLLENCALVFLGEKGEGVERLIDPKLIDDKEYFLSTEIYTLEYIQPDFLIFRWNDFVQDNNLLRVAGIPDLAVEVWSKSNKKIDRELKFRIYSSSDECEHWHIEQDSNAVTCYKGKQRFNDQCLTKPLKTMSDLEFDLSHLAL